MFSKWFESTTAASSLITIIYGEVGVGKTSLACEFTKLGGAILLSTENNLPRDANISCINLVNNSDNLAKYDPLHKFRLLLKDIYDQEILRDAHGNKVKTLIIDNLSSIDTWLQLSVLEENKLPDLNSSYGEGRGILKKRFDTLIDYLYKIKLKHNVHMVFIAHSAIVKKESQNHPPFDYATLGLFKSAEKRLTELADNIFYITRDLHITTGKKTNKVIDNDSIIIITEGKPSCNAKNRLGIPPVCNYIKGKGLDQFIKYFEPYAIPSPEEDGKEGDKLTSEENLEETTQEVIESE